MVTHDQFRARRCGPISGIFRDGNENIKIRDSLHSQQLKPDTWNVLLVLHRAVFPASGM